MQMRPSAFLLVWKNVLLQLSLLALTYSCSSMSNRVDNDILNCGSDFDGSEKYFIVTAPDGRRLHRNEIEIVNIETEKGYEKLSSRGCVSLPNTGHFLIKSKNADWSQVIDSQNQIFNGVVNLYDYSGEHIAVACSKDTKLTVSDDFSLDSILISNISESLKKSYQINVDITSKFKKFRRHQTINYSELTSSFKPFLKQVYDGEFEMTVTVRNLSLNKNEKSTSCTINIDQTPPSVEFSINQQEAVNKTRVHNVEDIALLHPGDEVSFVSKDSDTGEVSYCFQKIEDDFSKNDISKRKTWEKEVDSLTCPDQSIVLSEVNKPISMNQRKGFWAIRYFARDRLGNRSIMKKKVFLFFHKETIDFVNQTGRVSVRTSLFENNSLGGSLEALKAFKLFKTLPTRFERDLAAPAVLTGLLDTAKLPAIDTNLENRIPAIFPFTVSKDGSQLIGVQSDLTVAVWDTKKRKLLRSFGEISGNAASIVLSRDDKKAYIATTNGDLSSWDITEGRLLHSLHEPSTSFAVITTSSDGRKIITGDMRGNVAVRNIDTLDIIHQVSDAFNSRILSLDVSPDNRYFAASSRNSKDFTVWNLENGQLVRKFSGHSSSVDYLRFSKDALHLFSVSTDNTARKWELESGKDVKTVHADFRSSVWDDETREIVKTLGPFGPRPIAVLLTQDERSLILGMSKGRVEKIDFESDRVSFVYHSPYKDIGAIAVDSVGDTIYASPYSGEILKLDLSQNLFSREIQPIRPDGGTAFALQFDSFNKFIKYFSTSGVFRKWSLDKTVAEEMSLKLDLSISNPSISTDGSKVHATSVIGSEVFDFEKAIMVSRIRPPSPNAIFSTDSANLISFDGKRMLIIDAISGVLERSVEIPADPTRASVSPNGQTIILAFEDSVQTYDFKTLALTHQFNAPLGSSTHSLSMDNSESKILANTSVVYIWDVDSEKLIRTLKDSNEDFISASFAQDDNVVVTLGNGESIKAWHLQSGDLLTTLYKSDSKGVDRFNLGPSVFTTIQFNGQGDKLAAANSLGFIKIFDFNIEILKQKLCVRLRDIVEHSLCS